MAERPLTERQEAILKLPRERDEDMTANAIAYSLGFRNARSKGGLGGGRGSGAGTAAAQHVITSLTGLRKRGLVYMTRRPDGLAGTAYRAS
jgi:hypothetical protein